VEVEKEEELSEEEQYKQYNITVSLLASYMSIGGLYFTREGQSYEIYNNLNLDPTSHKMYNNSLRNNPHNMMELQFNLNDSTLLGSENSFNATKEILNNFQLRFDKFKLSVDAYVKCKSQQSCSKIVDASNSEILQYLMETEYSRISKTAMSVA
jgi:hypothetical protein